MGNVSERLLALRPVTFRYKQGGEDGGKPMQFGLIAEEVAEASPELVIYDSEGQPGNSQLPPFGDLTSERIPERAPCYAGTGDPYRRT